jgi:hypothetical protein
MDTLVVALVVGLFCYMIGHEVAKGKAKDREDARMKERCRLLGHTAEPHTHIEKISGFAHYPDGGRDLAPAIVFEEQHKGWWMWRSADGKNREGSAAAVNTDDAGAIVSILFQRDEGSYDIVSGDGLKFVAPVHTTGCPEGCIG